MIEITLLVPTNLRATGTALAIYIGVTDTNVNPTHALKGDIMSMTYANTYWFFYAELEEVWKQFNYTEEFYTLLGLLGVQVRVIGIIG